MRAAGIKNQSETERAKHPAKVLTVTVDAALDNSSVVILRPVPDSFFERRPNVPADVPDPRPLSDCGGPAGPPITDWTYARTRITTRRFWARPSRVLFGAIGLSSP